MQYCKQRLQERIKINQIWRVIKNINSYLDNIKALRTMIDVLNGYNKKLVIYARTVMQVSIESNDFKVRKRKKWTTVEKQTKGIPQECDPA